MCDLKWLQCNIGKNGDSIPIHEVLEKLMYMPIEPVEFAVRCNNGQHRDWPIEKASKILATAVLSLRVTHKNTVGRTDGK